MSETNGSHQKEKAAKVRRKTGRESVLSPTFARARHSIDSSLWDRNQQGSGLLQRQCACGTHTIGGGECNACLRKQESSFLQRTSVASTQEAVISPDSIETPTFSQPFFRQDFSQIPIHSATSQIINQPSTDVRTQSSYDMQIQRNEGWAPIVCQYSLRDATTIETAIARQSLTKSSQIANRFLVSVGALSGRGRFIPTVLDNKYWFAKLYQLITYYEIAQKHRFRYPAFVMHFIPIFYDLYANALQHFLRGEVDQISPLWLRHFRAAGRPPRGGGMDWLNGIQQSIVTGVSTHIKGDMATALEQAFRSYVAKYCLQDASFDNYKRDFFEANRPIFEQVKGAFFLEMSRLGPSPLSMEMTQFIFGAGEQIAGGGLPVDVIYQWREKAWQEALSNLSAS